LLNPASSRLNDSSRSKAVTTTVARGVILFPLLV
jgi:hypothetical protein